MALRHTFQGLTGVPDTPDRLDELRARLRVFVQEREWQQFHDPKNLAMCLGSEVGELLAELRWVASAEADKLAYDIQARARIAQELGDVGIAWLLLCDRMGLDPLQVVQDKLELNRKAYPLEKSRGLSEKP